MSSVKVTTFTNVVDVDAETKIKNQIEVIEKSLSASKKNRKQLLEDLNRERRTKWAKFFANFSSFQGYELVQREDIIEDKGFKVGRNQTLGTGNFGTAYQSCWKFKGKDMAIKIISLKKFQSAYGIKDLDRYLKILSEFRHPKLNSLVKIFNVAQTSKLYLIFPLAQKRSVQFIVDSTEKPIQTELAKMWTRDVIEAVAYLHSIGFAHRRINPRKVLIKDMASNAKLALPDGFVDLINPADPKQPRVKKSIDRPYTDQRPYSAYEAMFSSSYNESVADIWSIGCVLFFMLTNQSPFFFTRIQDKMKDEVKSQRWQLAGISRKGSKLSDNAKVFLAEIFQLDPEKRPTAIELITRPYLQIP